MRIGSLDSTMAKPMPNYVETFRATVAPADCDHLGHMNVQHYFRAVGDGMFAVMICVGLTPEEIRRRRLSFAVVRAETEFHRELYAGDVITLATVSFPNTSNVQVRFTW